MELFLIIGVIVLVVIAYRGVTRSQKRNAQGASKEELAQLHHEFLVRYAHNRKDSK